MGVNARANAPKKNAANRAGFSGAQDDKKHDISCANCATKRGTNAMSLYAKDRHKRAAKSLGYVLTDGTSGAWEGFTTIITARLTVEERAKLAMAALVTLDDDTAYRAASAALFGVFDGEVLV